MYFVLISFARYLLVMPLFFATFIAWPADLEQER